MIPSGLVVEEAERVAAGVEADVRLLLQDLEAWVNIDTPSIAVEQLDRLSAILARTVEQYGMHPELVPMPGVGLSLYASLHGEGRAKVALLCHHDTVFPLGTTEGWPFSYDDHRVYGPGVADMKGGIAVAVHAARLMATGPRPFGVVEVISCRTRSAPDGAGGDPRARSRAMTPCSAWSAVESTARSCLPERAPLVSHPCHRSAGSRRR